MATQEIRDRLLEPFANVRIDQWRIVRRGFDSAPLTGTGSGTYALLWERLHPYALQVEDGHSLYLEVLADLGAIGLLLAAVPILVILIGFARRARDPDLRSTLILRGRNREAFSEVA